MIIHNVQQGSSEWYMLRTGKLTASDAASIAENKSGLVTLCYEKAAEKLTGNITDLYQSMAMQYGKEFEPKARRAYEKQYGVEVQKIGFVEIDEYVGCSPDGFVGKDGSIEIKCKLDKGHLFSVLSEKIDSKHYAQMQMIMLLTDRKWCDYVCFNPLFKYPLHVRRVYPDLDVQEKISDGLVFGRDKISEIINKYKEVYSEQHISKIRKF